MKKSQTKPTKSQHPYKESQIINLVSYVLIRNKSRKICLNKLKIGLEEQYNKRQRRQCLNPQNHTFDNTQKQQSNEIGKEYKELQQRSSKSFWRLHLN